MGQHSKIDWCDATWNPVTGCLHGCKYCYARKIATRFKPGTVIDVCRDSAVVAANGGGVIAVLKNQLSEVTKDGKVMPSAYPLGFTPTFHKYRLDEPQKWKKPKTIFVCSMADLFGEWVPDEWIKEVFDACERAPWHRYIFLTKNPKRYFALINDGILKKHDNWWLGSTIDNRDAGRFQAWGYNSFTSIEPLTEYLDVGLGSFGRDKWVIIGAETGNRKGKIIPQREWVDNIVDAAAITQMKVFMKESIRELMGDDFRQEFPWGVSE